MTLSNPTAPLSGQAQTRPGPTRRVTDAPIRMFHWLFALCLVGAYASADGERWRLLHATLGYTLAGLLAFRVAYGLLGPRQARLAQMVRRLTGLRAWFRSIIAPSTSNLPDWRQGANLLMALAVVAMLATVVPVALSGYASYNDWGGQWLEEVHEFVGETFLWLVLLHVALLPGLSMLRRKNQALPMLTGRVAGAGPDLARRNHGWLALLLLAAVLTFWAWQWQHSPSVPLPGDRPALSRGHAHDNDRD